MKYKVYKFSGSLILPKAYHTEGGLIRAKPHLLREAIIT